MPTPFVLENMGKDPLFPQHSGEGLTVEFSYFSSALISSFPLKSTIFSPLGMKEEGRKKEK